MLSIYQVALDMTGEIHRLIGEIRVHDRKLADQLKDAWSSVVLNIAEGSGVRGGHRKQRYMTSLGSARESQGVLDYSERAGYIAPPSDRLVQGFGRIEGTLVKNVYPRRRS
jgi:four helix bundle protein